MRGETLFRGSRVEGGEQRVYLAHGTALDDDLAFAPIKTERLNATARDRLTRDAQTIGRPGAHPPAWPSP